MPSAPAPSGSSLYEKQYRFTLERNEAWYGSDAANRDAPGAVFPSDIDPEDIAEGRIDAAYAGRRLPFVDRVKFYRERESIPRFNKFLQGYYDDGGIIKESFDAVIQGDRLSPADGRARHAPRQDGGAEHPLHRLQHGRPGRRACRPARRAASCARP